MLKAVGGVDPSRRLVVAPDGYRSSPHGTDGGSVSVTAALTFPVPEASVLIW